MEAVAVEADCRAVKYCKNYSKETALLAVSKDGLLFADLHLVWQVNPDVILRAVQTNGMVLAHVLNVANDVNNANNAPDKELLFNKALVMAAVNQTGMALQHAGRFQDDSDVVMASLSNANSTRIDSYLAFQFASDRLRASPSFVAEVVAVAGENALEFVFKQKSH
jgi:hypothetical protein